MPCNGTCLNRCLCICGYTSTCTCVHSEPNHKTFRGGHDIYTYCRSKECNCTLIKCRNCQYSHPQWVLNDGLCALCIKNGNDSK